MYWHCGDFNSAPHMAAPKFQQCIKDAKLMVEPINTGIVDVVFLQVVGKKATRETKMSWDHFLLALCMLAVKKDPSMDIYEALEVLVESHMMLLVQEIPEHTQQCELFLKLLKGDNEIKQLFQDCRPFLQVLAPTATTL